MAWWVEVNAPGQHSRQLLSNSDLPPHVGVDQVIAPIWDDLNRICLAQMTSQQSNVEVWRVGSCGGTAAVEPEPWSFSNTVQAYSHVGKAFTLLVLLPTRMEISKIIPKKIQELE